MFRTSVLGAVILGVACLAGGIGAFNGLRETAGQHVGLAPSVRRMCQPSATIAKNLPIPRYLSRRQAGNTLRVAAEEELRGGPLDPTLPDQVLELAQKLEPRLKGSAVYLVGMMGSGKTNVGRILHNSLKYTFFDTDELVETVTGKSVSELFKEEGEDFFRTMEEEILQQLKPYTRIMVATGGGVVKSMKNWDAMRNGLVVWLDAPTSLLAERLEGEEQKDRPLLDLSSDAGEEGALEDKLATILQERRSLYQRADIRVSLDNAFEAGKVSPVKVALRVLKEIEKKIDEKDARDEEMKNYTINRDNINKLVD